VVRTGNFINLAKHKSFVFEGYPAAMDVDNIVASLQPNVRNDGGHTDAIVVRGPGAGKSAKPAAEGGILDGTNRAEPTPTPAGQEADSASQSVAQSGIQGNLTSEMEPPGTQEPEPAPAEKHARRKSFISIR
jgi:hypothetical protein